MNNICLCAIAKNENVYLDEWIQHYTKIGFDDIIIFDNNDENGEQLLTFQEKYNNVKIDLRYRGKTDKFYQNDAYTQFYKENLNNYDWIAFFDIDEILILQNTENIKDFLNLDIFNNCDCIRICWKSYTDNNIITVNDNNFSNSRFTETSTYQSIYCKSIIKGGLSYINRISSHGSYNVKYPVNCAGEYAPITNICLIGDKCCWQNAWLNHYRYRTLEEFLNKKIKNWHQENKNVTYNTIEDFFKLNEKTPEKIKYIEEYDKTRN